MQVHALILLSVAEGRRIDGLGAAALPSLRASSIAGSFDRTMRTDPATPGRADKKTEEEKWSAGWRRGASPGALDGAPAKPRWHLSPRSGFPDRRSVLKKR